MRLFILILFAIGCSKSWGQFARLVITNPSPRQGEELEITIVLDKENLEHLKVDIHEANTFDLLQKNNYALGTLKIKQVPTDTGQFSVGPFTFTIDGKMYQTEKRSVHIDQKLPDDIRDGIWVRHIKQDNKDFLVVEQRISTDKTSQGVSGRTIADHINEGVVFARLDISKLKQLGIVITPSPPMRSAQYLGDKTPGTFWGYLSYGRTVYEFNLTSKDSVSITKELFQELPPTTYFEGVVIKN